MPDKEKPLTIKIKKYANRRLYNTATSAYVTLEDLSRMVKENQDFVVVDAKTGEDITQPVLTQVIFEEEAKGQSLLPTNFLRQLIQLYGHTLQGFVPSYLEQSMQALVSQQENLHKTFGANPTVANLNLLAKNNMAMFQKTMEMFIPFKQNTNTPETPVHNPEEKTHQSIHDIQVQLADLQEKLNHLSTK